MVIKELRHSLNKYYFDKEVFYRIRILGVILLTLGILLFWNTLGINKKISLSLILIAIFMLFFIPEKSIHGGKEISVFLFLTVWLVIMFFITGDTIDTNLDIFFFLVVLGMLIFKELGDVFLTPQLKNRLFFLNLMFFSLCMIIIAEKVISFFYM